MWYRVVSSQTVTTFRAPFRMNILRQLPVKCCGSRAESNKNLLIAYHANSLVFLLVGYISNNKTMTDS